MPQDQYTERPHKVLAEQYDAAAMPLQAGVCVCTVNPMYWSDGRPHVHTPRGMFALAAGDWILEDPWTPWQFDRLSNEEFDARYGKGNLADVTPKE
jgi:hypothetical protein